MKKQNDFLEKEAKDLADDKNYPDFFIPGMCKAGSTSIYHYLSQHPEVFMSDIKEPGFFSNDFTNGMKMDSLSEYLKLYEDATVEHKRLGEADIKYLISSEAVSNIYEFNPNSDFIILLRNTVEMLRSLHDQLLLNGAETVKDFEEAWNLQDKRKKGKAMPKNWTYDFFIPEFLQYEEVGRMGSHVERLLDFFPREQVHFVLLEDLKENPKKTFDEILQFLDVKQIEKNDFERYNQRKIPRSTWLKLITNIKNPPFLSVWRSIKKSLGLENTSILGFIRERNEQESPGRPPLRREFRKELIDIFRPDIKKLESIINRDLSHWYK